MQNKLKTLVIGSTGLLGIALVHELLNRGKEVKVTVRHNSPQGALDELKRMDVEIVYADIREKDNIKKALAQVEEVYLTAALFKTWHQDLSEFKRTNIEGSKNVFDLCRKQGIRRVVYTSSHGTIGLTNYPEYADESVSASMEQFRGTSYLESKYYSEQAALEYSKKDLDIVIVNPVGIIGINDFGCNITNNYIRDAAKGYIPRFYVNAYLSLVDSRDAAVGHIQAMEKGKAGERYILGGDNISYKEYFTYLKQLTKIKKKLVPIPLLPLLTSSYLFKWKAMLSSSEPVITPDSIKFVMKGTRYSSKKAQDNLGYQFRPIKESISEVYEWFKEIMLNN
jgi:dihydroflavonol-4-reductase